MSQAGDKREILTIMLLCLLWYVTSSSSNVAAKALLSKFPYPMTVTMVQLLTITIFSGPVFNAWGVRKTSSTLITWRYYFKLIVPLALGKFLSNVLSHVSIWKVPVSYAHTGKYYKYTFHLFLRVCIFDKLSYEAPKLLAIWFDLSFFLQVY